MVSQKGALVELSEVAVKSEDAKTRRTMNQGMKRRREAFAGRPFRKGVKAKTKTKAKAFNNKMEEEEKSERLGACELLSLLGSTRPRFQEIGCPKQV